VLYIPNLLVIATGLAAGANDAPVVVIAMIRQQIVDSCHVDPGFLDVDPPLIRAIKVRA
jgi:hypothetical protein